jgi:hypothetical protein
MPASGSTDIHATDTFQSFFGAVMCVCLCVKELRALDAFSAQVLSTTSNLNNTSVSSVALLLAICLEHFCFTDLIQDMKLGQQTR